MLVPPPQGGGLNSGKPTRYDCNGKGTAPDVTLVHSSMVSKAEWVIGEDISSDHRPLITTLELDGHRQKETRKLRPCLKKADWNKFRELTEMNLSNNKFQKLKCPQAVIKRFNRTVGDAAKQAIPLVLSRRNPKAWWSPEVEKAVKKRRRYQKARNKNKNPQTAKTLRKEYNEVSQETKDTIREAKASHMEEFCNSLDTSTDPNKIFSTMKRICGTNKKRPATLPLKRGNKVASSNQEKANMMAQQFPK